MSSSSHHQQNPTQGNIQRLTRANNASSAAINGELMNLKEAKFLAAN
jgi:hypothetical protein